MSFFKKLFGGSEPVADETPKEESKNFDILKYDGVRALRTNQAQYAAQCFEHALALKDDLECRDYLSQALLQTGDLRGSYEQLTLLTASCPDNVGILLRMAEVAFMMEDYSAMLDACQKALTLDDSNAMTYYMHARGSHGGGEDATAVTMLDKALSLNEEFDAARLLRGQVHLAMANYDAAAADVEQLIERVGENEDVYLLKAHLAEVTDRPEEAVEAYSKVIDLNPFCAEAFRGRGILRHQLGDDEGAEADRQSADELDSSAPATQESVEQKVKDAYKSIDPYGVFGQ